MAGTAEPGEVATLIDKINGFKTTAENILNNEGKFLSHRRPRSHQMPLLKAWLPCDSIADVVTLHSCTCRAPTSIQETNCCPGEARRGTTNNSYAGEYLSGLPPSESSRWHAAENATIANPRYVRSCGGGLKALQHHCRRVAE